jgi:hypothetical protein
MKSKMLPFVVLAGVLAAFLFASSCGNGSAVCPTCGTDKNGTVGLIAVMLVPDANGNGEPGGPFNIFDISWVDPVNHLYYVTDRIHLDVPIFSTATDIGLFAIGGDNSVAEAGNNASGCFNDAAGTQIIPPITTAQGNYTRFGCKTMGFRLPGFFGPNGHYGGFLGGQCCASRSNNLNPLTGPNGIETSADGTILFVGNGSSHTAVFDMTATLASNGATAPTVIATLVSGTSPDYDGVAPPNGGISGCEVSANGRAFSDPTCGDLRADEMATTGATPAIDPAGNPHDLLMVINGDPGLPFVTIFDVTHVVHKTGTVQQQHCLPVNPAAPYSPGGPMTTFPANFATCNLGQIYYDGSPANNINTVIDDGGANAGIPCPNPSLQFGGAPGAPGPAVPSGASGHGVGLGGADIPCHRAAFIPAFNATEVALAGLGGMVYNPNTGHFLLTNGNASNDITLGTVDEIDPFHTFAGGPPLGVPAVINSFPMPSCMPSGIAMGPGTDALVTCAGHDGRQFAPTTYIINGTTGAILATINNVGGVDQGWFNPGDNRYYLAARDLPTGPVLGVIDAKGRQWLQNVPTNGNAHSVAADPKFNKIYVPLAAGGNCQSQAIDGCVGVYARQ